MLKRLNFRKLRIIRKTIRKTRIPQKEKGVQKFFCTPLVYYFM